MQWRFWERFVWRADCKPNYSCNIFLLISFVFLVSSLSVAAACSIVLFVLLVLYWPSEGQTHRTQVPVLPDMAREKNNWVSRNKPKIKPSFFFKKSSKQWEREIFDLHDKIDIFTKKETCPQGSNYTEKQARMWLKTTYICRKLYRKTHPGLLIIRRLGNPAWYWFYSAGWVNDPVPPL